MRREKKPTKEEKIKDSQLLAKRALEIQRGGARAAVLGVNDGLVSVLCLVLVVGGAGADNDAVLLAGFGGLIAGAISMAAGEWISVRSQVELFRGVLKDIKRMANRDRELLVEQLEVALSESGHSDKTAKKAADEIGKDDKHLVSAYANQVMGFNPDELGSPWVAAWSSFALFTAGALAPIAPWLFSEGTTAVITSIVLTGLGGIIVGGYISRTSGTNIAHGALRQFGIIVLASVVTYGIGYLFGTTVS